MNQLHEFQYPQGLIPYLPLLLLYRLRPKPCIPDPLPPLVLRYEHQIFEYGHMAKLPGNLECAADFPLEDLVGGQAVDSVPVEEDLATVGFVEARHQVEEGRFTRPIGPYKPGNGFIFDLKAAIIYGPEATEALIQRLHFQHFIDSMGGITFFRANENEAIK